MLTLFAYYSSNISSVKQSVAYDKGNGSSGRIAVGHAWFLKCFRPSEFGGKTEKVLSSNNETPTCFTYRSCIPIN